MKHLLMLVFSAMLLSCAGAAAQPQSAELSNDTASAWGSPQAEIDYLWAMMYEKDAIIEGLQGELLAYQGSDYDLTHVVKRDESLWTISRDVLDDPYAWVALYSVNQFMIADPDLIYPFQVLLLP